MNPLVVVGITVSLVAAKSRAQPNPRGRNLRWHAARTAAGIAAATVNSAAGLALPPLARADPAPQPPPPTLPADRPAPPEADDAAPAPPPDPAGKTSQPVHAATICPPAPYQRSPAQGRAARPSRVPRRPAQRDPDADIRGPAAGGHGDQAPPSRNRAGPAQNDTLAT